MDLETEHQAIDDIKRWIIADRSISRLEGALQVVADTESDTDLGRDCLRAINTINMLKTHLNIIRIDLNY
ncbi:hypothetical protein [Bifidobacterium magnum]|uniref:Uncharacterized protein n=1 Tax=Bifidobacterium magnum TaxID=1692 RepID=A0A087B9P6_9BIFI|nr:hypothetical protein [Bifidobacterium magnum]KFI67746.1 hypothetical protein BMAGN_1556 [Bifidobacterium magnum]